MNELTHSFNELSLNMLNDANNLLTSVKESSQRSNELLLNMLNYTQYSSSELQKFLNNNLKSRLMFSRARKYQQMYCTAQHYTVALNISKNTMFYM